MGVSTSTETTTVVNIDRLAAEARRLSESGMPILNGSDDAGIVQEILREYGGYTGDINKLLGTCEVRDAISRMNKTFGIDSSELTTQSLREAARELAKRAKHPNKYVLPDEVYVPSSCDIPVG